MYQCKDISSCGVVQEGELKEVLSECLAGEGVHVIELPIDYAMSAQLQVSFSFTGFWSPVCIASMSPCLA